MKYLVHVYPIFRTVVEVNDADSPEQAHEVAKRRVHESLNASGVVELHFADDFDTGLVDVLNEDGQRNRSVLV